jgi:hypothetical protein
VDELDRVEEALVVAAIGAGSAPVAVSPARGSTRHQGRGQGFKVSPAA